MRKSSSSCICLFLIKLQLSLSLVILAQIYSSLNCIFWAGVDARQTPMECAQLLTLLIQKIHSAIGHFYEIATTVNT